MDKRSEDLNNYLEAVENFLMANIASNFDQFSDSFEQLREMEREMADVVTKIKTIKENNATCKENLKTHILKIYLLNRRKRKMKQARDHLKLLKMLKESIPVIRNLIESGNSFDTAMQLMENAFKLINRDLAPLHVA